MDILEVIDAYFEFRWLKWAVVFLFGASVGSFTALPWQMWSMTTGVLGACMLIVHLTRDK